MNIPKKAKIALFVSPLAILLGFMFLTDPDNVPLAFLLTPFIILGLAVFLLIKYLIIFFRRPKNSIRLNIFSAVAALIAVNFLLLRSIDQLSFQDGLISLAITAIIGFYITKFQLD